MGAFVGFNLAHGAGNLLLNLHNDEAGFKNIRAKGDDLTRYLEWPVQEECGNKAQAIGDALKACGVVVDFRDPDILRMVPAPIYNSFEDIYELVQIIKKTIN